MHLWRLKRGDSELPNARCPALTGTARVVFAMALLVACACRGPSPDAPPLSGPFATVCEDERRPSRLQTQTPTEPQVAASALAATLWVRTLSEPQQGRVTRALEEAADGFELLLFGGEGFVDVPPAQVLASALTETQATLATMQALANASVGIGVGGRRVRLRASCPSPIRAGCRCVDLRRPDAAAQPAVVRSIVWPIVDGAAIRVGQSPRLRRLRACVLKAVQAEGAAVGAVVWPLAVATHAGPKPALRRAARRLERAVRKSGKRFAVGVPLLQGLQASEVRDVDWLRRPSDEVWVVPRLSRIATGELGRMTRRCVAQTRARSRR